MKALIIDDSRAIRSVLERMMKQLGFDVTLAADGQEGLDRLKDDSEFDVALVDWEMPKLNGYEFVCTVRADSEFDDTRLMMVTSITEVSKVEEALVAGADEYLMKPFTPEMLREKLSLLGVSDADSCAEPVS